MSRQRSSVLAGVLLLTVAPAAANAQSGGCDTARRSVGAAVGRSDPYFEPSLGVSAAGTSGSVQSRGGWQFAGRTDLPIAGAWRARVEGGAVNWRLERDIYTADLRQVTATEKVADLDVYDIVGQVGWQGGRAPACAYVLAGGGLYSLHYQGTSFWSPGFALTAGIEFPAGPRGAVQLDLQVHLINTGTGGRYPIGSSTVVDGRFSAGWGFRF